MIETRSAHCWWEAWPGRLCELKYPGFSVTARVGAARCVDLEDGRVKAGDWAGREVEGPSDEFGVVVFEFPMLDNLLVAVTPERVTLTDLGWAAEE